MSEVRVEIGLRDLKPLQRYLAMDEFRMVEVAVAYLLDNPRNIRDWIASGGSSDDVKADKAPRRYLAIDPMAAERAATDADRDDSTGCLVSRCTVNGEGYAMVNWQEPGGFGYGAKRRMVPAARAAFAHHFGSVPDGYRVTQACHNRRCVAKDHLALRGPRET